MRVIHSEKNHHILQFTQQQSTTSIQSAGSVSILCMIHCVEWCRQYVSHCQCYICRRGIRIWIPVAYSFFFGYCFHSSAISPQLDRPMIKYNIQRSYLIWRHAHNHQQQKLSFTSLSSFTHAALTTTHTTESESFIS